MPSKYSQDQIRQIAKDLPEALLKHAWNRTKAAKEVGLESWQQITGLMSNHPAVASAYNKGISLITDEVLEAHMSAAMDRRRGMNTQASGRFLAVAMSEWFNPTVITEDRTGYQVERAGDSAPSTNTSPPALTVVNGAESEQPTKQDSGQRAK